MMISRLRGTSLLLFLFMTTELTSITNGWGIKATTSDVVIGKDATLKCDVTGVVVSGSPSGFEEPIASTLAIESNDKQLYYYRFFPPILSVNATTSDSRYLYNTATYTMTIKDVNCSDQATLKCILEATTSAGGQKKTSEAPLTVKVPPLVPDPMTTTPDNVTRVKEGDDISAECFANTGKTNKGKIQWRIYRNNVEDIIVGNGGNGVAVSNSQTSPLPNEPPCSVRTRSTLRINNITVEDQNLVLTCFVINDDFPAQQSNCDSAEKSFCQQSQTIRVLYSVRALKVTKGPASDDVVKGRDVTLNCDAEGFPRPTFEWSNVEENRTILSGLDGRLVLSNVDLKDAGNYSCTATNIVDGKTYHKTSVVAINVVLPPPTTSTDPTDTTVPTRPTKSNVKGSDDDDSTTIIVVVIVVVVAVVIAAIVGVCIYRKKRQSKEDPPRPKDISFYNNKQTMSSPPDVLGDEKKKPIGGNLNNSFDMTNEDGLRYADLTYDNRPRSRKPMAIGDAASDYSDVQMPQV